MKPLTPNQDRFVQEYLLDLNATQAAIRAGYSEKSAASQGERLLRNAEIKTAIDEALSKRAQRVEVKADDILRELMRIALADISQAYGDDGQLLKIKEMPEEIRRAIAGIETEELFEGFGEDRTRVGDTVKVKFWNKPQALELLGKHLKLFTDKVEHSGEVNIVNLNITRQVKK